jgi:hypothetical protein
MIQMECPKTQTGREGKSTITRLVWKYYTKPKKRTGARKG